MFTVFLFYKEKEQFTGEGCVEMDIPWQLCQTIGPLTLHSQEIIIYNPSVKCCQIYAYARAFFTIKHRCFVM